MCPRYILILSAIIAQSSAGFAQQPAQSAAAVLQTAQRSAGEIEQLRLALRSPDASTRIATFTALVESSNASLVTLAVNEGHASSDAILRDLAVRTAFRENKNVIVEPTAPLAGDPLQRFHDFQKALSLVIYKYDPTSGVFSYNGGTGQGQISGNHLSFGNGECSGNMLALEGSWAFEGGVVCTNGAWRLAERMRVDIR